MQECARKAAKKAKGSDAARHRASRLLNYDWLDGGDAGVGCGKSLAALRYLARSSGFRAKKVPEREPFEIPSLNVQLLPLADHLVPDKLNCRAACARVHLA